MRLKRCKEYVGNGWCLNKKTELKALPPSTTAGNANEDEDYDKID